MSYWYLLRRPSGIDFAAVPPLSWIAFAVLVGFGQVGCSRHYRPQRAMLIFSPHFEAWDHACIYGNMRLHAHAPAHPPHNPAAAPTAANPDRWPLQVASTAFLLQWLNVGIFNAIGHAGVYYGFKLGHTVPWVSGFPFNVVAHPQYVGSVATVLGGAALVSWVLLVRALPHPASRASGMAAALGHAALARRACHAGFPLWPVAAWGFANVRLSPSGAWTAR